MDRKYKSEEQNDLSSTGIDKYFTLTERLSRSMIISPSKHASPSAIKNQSLLWAKRAQKIPELVKIIWKPTAPGISENSPISVLIPAELPLNFNFIVKDSWLQLSIVKKQKP